jgi:hypothetical protein
LHDSSSAARSDATIATVLDVAGGALAVAAIVTWLAAAPPSEAARTGLHIEPTLSPRMAGLHLGLDF